MGRNRPKRTHAKNKSGHKERKNRNRAKDLDQIQDELASESKKQGVMGNVVTAKATDEPDPDLPGLGQYYCIPCARYFVGANALEEHNKTKPHRRRLKLAMEKPYSQREAEAAAGMASPVKRTK